MLLATADGYPQRVIFNYDIDRDTPESVAAEMFEERLLGSPRSALNLSKFSKK